MATPPKMIEALAVEPRRKPSNYPSPFAERMTGRIKRQLGDVFGLRSFGVNVTTLAPGASTALHHRHTHQDEFVYCLDGHPTLYIGTERFQLSPGLCAGFPASGEPHHIVNETDDAAMILEIGDRNPADSVSYPDDDLVAVMDHGTWSFERKDGSRYE